VVLFILSALEVIQQFRADGANCIAQDLECGTGRPVLGSGTRDCEDYDAVFAFTEKLERHAISVHTRGNEEIRSHSDGVKERCRKIESEFGAYIALLSLQ
jgi:hypothetical protein